MMASHTQMTTVVEIQLRILFYGEAKNRITSDPK